MQTKVAVFLSLLGCSLAYLALSQLHSRSLASHTRLDIPVSGLALPMQDFQGRPVVEVTIGGKGPYRFILDTGATASVIGNELNRELLLKAIPGVIARTGGNGPAPAIVEIPELRLAGAVLEDMIAAVMPLSRVVSGKDAPRGVLSASGFPGYLVTFNYPAKLISITKGALPQANLQDTFEYAESRDLPAVPIRIAGHETWVTLDTGSGSGLTLPTRFLRELPIVSPPKEGAKAKLIGGDFPVSIAQVNGSIEVGKYRLELADVRFSDERGGAGPATGDIGYDALRNFVVILDSKNRRIRLLR